MSVDIDKICSLCGKRLGEHSLAETYLCMEDKQRKKTKPELREMLLSVCKEARHYINDNIIIRTQLSAKEKEIEGMRKQIASIKHDSHRMLDEALNSGDGVYRP